MKLNILGTEYAVVVKKYDEDEAFARLNIDGYCDGLIKKPVGQERGDGGLDRPPGPEDLQGLGRCGGALKEGCRCSRLMTS